MNTFCLWIRSVGRISATPFLAVAMMILVVFLYRVNYLEQLPFVLLVGVSFCWLMTFPLAIVWKFAPGETALDRYLKVAAQARNRAELRRHGLSVEEYIATLNGLDADHKSVIYEKYGFNQKKN